MENWLENWKERNVAMDSVQISIDGLEFNEVQERVRNQLEGIVGVQGVYLSEGQDYVGIKYDDQTSVAEIDSHLKNNGYKVIDICETKM